MQLNDIESAIDVVQQCWLDTYVSKTYKISRQWITHQNNAMKSPEAIQNRRRMFMKQSTAGWIARDGQGNIIGMVGPYIDNEKIQRLGSLYVIKEWHGQGVGSALMQEVIEWFNPDKPIILEVAAYNLRARAFYKKWNFHETAQSCLFAGKIPELVMVRPAGKLCNITTVLSPPADYALVKCRSGRLPVSGDRWESNKTPAFHPLNNR